MKAVIYARKSTEDRKKQVHSIADQLRILRKIAKDRGIEVVEEITEEKSAKDLGRPGFGRLTELIYKKEVSAVLTWALDRLARNQADGGQLTHLVQTGLLDKIITPEIEYNQGTSPLLFAVKFGMANEFIIDLSRNVKRGLKSRLEQGYYPFCAPFGYKNKNKECVLDYRSPIVELIFDRYDSGDYSIGQITELVRDRYRIKIYKSSINKILRNPFYKGLMIIKGETYKGRHEPVVSQELFNRVQDRLTGNAQPMNSKHLYTYTRLIKCEDGRNLVGYEKKGHVYYRRTNNQTLEVWQSGRLAKQVSEKALTKMVFEILNGNKWDDLFPKALSRIYDLMYQDKSENSEVYRKNIMHQLKRLDSRLEKTKERFWDSETITEEDFIEQKERIKAKKEGLLTQLKEEEHKKNDDFVSSIVLLQRFTKVSPERFSDMEARKRRELIQILFGNIELSNSRLLIDESPFYLNLVTLNKRIEKQKIELPKKPSQKEFDAFCYRILDSGRPHRTGLELLKSLEVEFVNLNLTRKVKRLAITNKGFQSAYLKGGE